MHQKTNGGSSYEGNTESGKIKINFGAQGKQAKIERQKSIQPPFEPQQMPSMLMSNPTLTKPFK